jgi:hypothetical protein
VASLVADIYPLPQTPGYFAPVRLNILVYFCCVFLSLPRRSVPLLTLTHNIRSTSRSSNRALPMTARQICLDSAVLALSSLDSGLADSSSCFACHGVCLRADPFSVVVTYSTPRFIQATHHLFSQGSSACLYADATCTVLFRPLSDHRRSFKVKRTSTPDSNRRAARWLIGCLLGPIAFDAPAAAPTFCFHVACLSCRVFLASAVQAPPVRFICWLSV